MTVQDTVERVAVAGPAVVTGETDRESVDRTVGSPDEIADLARFPVCEAASFLTGETITPRGVPDIAEAPRT